MTTLCRVCLMEGNDCISIFTDIGSGLLSEKVMFCATVEVSIDDKLPSNLCSACVTKLDVSYNFKLQCEAADCWLRENLDFLTVKNEETIDTEEIDSKETRSKRIHSKSDIKRKSARIIAKSQIEVKDTYCQNTVDGNIAINIKEEEINVKVEHSVSQDDDDFKYEDIIDFVNDNDDDSDYFGDKEHIKKQHKRVKKKKDKHDKKKKKKRGRKPKIYYDENGDITLEKPPVRYCCEHCGKYFTSSSYLKVHSRIHLGVKAFECSTCGKKFSTRDYLRKHSRTHSDVKLYKCQYCPKGFNDWGSRQKHERIHRKERPYVCDICGKRFTYSYTMTKHKLIHSGLKMFSCDICKRNFTMKYHLKSHQMRVHKDTIASLTQSASTGTPKTDNLTIQNTQSNIPVDQDIVNTVRSNGIPIVSSSDDIKIVEYDQLTDNKPLSIPQSEQMTISETGTFGICAKLTDN